MKKHKKAIFIFRRDLRLNDNTGLIKAVEQSKVVIPCFIFDPRQVGPLNSFKSNNAIQFMIESLQDLHQQLKKKKGRLYLFYGLPHLMVKKLIKEENVDSVFCNKDYTPFSIKRDEQIKKVCLQSASAFNSLHDELLHDPNLIKTQGGTPYQVFTFYFKQAQRFPIATPIALKKANFYTKPINKAQPVTLYKKILKKQNKNIWVNGGTKNTQKILKNIKKFKDYPKTRDFPAKPTTYLSASNKFGTVSIRQVYYAIKKTLGNHLLIQQLYWRDFFTQVAYFSPFVYGNAYRQKYNKIKWSKNKSHFKKWTEGQTGFPIVDAGMRQMNETGFMHNRVRMIVGSFLTKDLHINWLKGEKYFAQQLVDYDPAVNNGNWQWVASTGCDAQPYFRIFNPWSQQKKFDPQCIYIKRWVSELKNIDPKIIHNWFKKAQKPINGYPRPMVDHAKESKIALKMYRSVR